MNKMQNNNTQKDGGHNGTAWMMIPCLLLLGLLLLRGGLFSSGGLFWPILIGIAVIVYIWMMFRGRGKHDDFDMGGKTDDASAKSEATNEHKHGGCCH